MIEGMGELGERRFSGVWMVCGMLLSRVRKETENLRTKKKGRGGEDPI